MLNTMAVGIGEKNLQPAVNDDEKPSLVPRPTNEDGVHDEPEKNNMDDLIRSARLATEKEQNMSLLQGIKLYPKPLDGVFSSPRALLWRVTTWHSSTTSTVIHSSTENMENPI